MKKFIIIFGIILSPVFSNGQVLISLVLGDDLNTGKVEFGLDGGLNYFSIAGLKESKAANGFHLGFYFDIKTKSKWLVHTGVIVKSSMGVAGIKPYSLNNQELDTLFTGGEVERNLRYFNVPFMMKYVFKNNFYLEGGIQLGLMYKAFDEFTQEIKDKNDLKYKLDIRKQFHPIDGGLAAGIGYRLMGGNGMNLAIRYYYGVVDITVDDSTKNQYNRSLYFAVGIPIGAGKAKAKREQMKD